MPLSSHSPPDRNIHSAPNFVAERHPLFAALYDVLTMVPERTLLTGLRAELLTQATGRVLEIGAGTGRNLPLYSRATRVVATEPDPDMVRQVRRRLPDAPVPVELLQARAEALPFPDGSFDTVVSTLVLCTVSRPHKALQEIRRVLIPGGRLLVLEHVRAKRRHWQVLQDSLTPLWRIPGAGCRLNRPTLSWIESEGFTSTFVSEVTQGLLPIRVGCYRAP